MDEMRIVLAGTRSFGAAVLEELGSRVVAVIAPVGDRLAESAVSKGLPVSTEVSERLVRGFDADLLIAAHSHAFIGARTRKGCKIGAVGYHPSLLPRHRGRDAVRWAVHMGDPIAGGSVYWLTDSVDAGPIAAQDWCWIRPGMTASGLWAKELFPMGVRLISEVVADLELGMVVRQEQDEAMATWEPSWGRAPMFRPELPELGPMPSLNGKPMRVVNLKHAQTRN